VRFWNSKELNVVLSNGTEKKHRQRNCYGEPKWVDITYDSITDLRRYVEIRVQIVATTPHDNDSLMDDFDIAKPVPYFFLERDGLSEEMILQRADGFLKSYGGRIYEV
jgi:tRNA (guanosine-2'-O-)-methyltransferase